MIQSSERDKMVIVPFNDTIIDSWYSDRVSSGISGLNNEIQNLSPGGSTDIFTPVVAGLEFFEDVDDLDEYFPAIILMTDGISNDGDIDDVYDALSETTKDIPIFSIMFGDASESQLTPMSEKTGGRVFDGRKNLISAFRKAKGYN